MNTRTAQDVFINLGGQDDNLGDSALRAAYYEAARGEGTRFHILLENRSSDYVTGLPLDPADLIYTKRSAWVAASDAASRPVQLFEAGEINPRGRAFPVESVAAPLRRSVDSGGLVIVAGMGLKDPSTVDPACFDSVLRDAAVVSWRDAGSRDAAGFGDVAPDWAFALGAPTADWADRGGRPLLAVTLRFDRPWPDDAWLVAVRALATQTSTRIVTVAQVARDAPRAVRLAEALGGEYLVAASTRHSDLDAHVRDVYSRSLVVISDRAHGLIIGATEGAYPIGSAADPQKISRLLAAADLGSLVSSYDRMPDAAAELESKLPELGPAVDKARASVVELGQRIRSAMSAVS
ncbi:hypothetical protein [Demequina muriae]|uniref:Polysaccharide pyruvyl transferase family protein WcaK n=1 Tax=Demequina muriae TaxID=3051664 RepID=A0ABT8GGE7_9MICO|nr:hypothetical protein [Demequina sp. EGI L300058]MDN4480429.1 hypothetical protein [Demequina sp. EGI L300058]